MIIWLASYPRSGNTLLRTVLKGTMGLGSYSDEVVLEAVGFTETSREQFGDLPLPRPWETFYREASAGKGVHLVKTHRAPVDDQPAIYVVRDGRRTLASYLEYHRRFLGDEALDLLSLVLGLDYYGGWSERYRRWVGAGRNTLVLRYEQLVEAPPALLAEVARFIGHEGAVAPWHNPFERLHRENPAFFRQAQVAWEPTPEWSPFVTGLFFLLHGELMQELGYADAAAVRTAVEALPAEARAWAAVTGSLRERGAALDAVCRERLAVIEGLDREVARLRQVCEARLAQIERLNARLARGASRGGTRERP